MRRRLVDRGEPGGSNRPPYPNCQNIKINDPPFLSLSANQSHHVAPATFPRTAKFSTWMHQDPPNQKRRKIMSDTESSKVEAFLADVSKRPQQRGNLIFALDATASRERTWDTAARLQVQMFREAAVIWELPAAAGFLSCVIRFFGGD